MSRRDDTLRLQDMLVAAHDARALAAGKTVADLSHDKQLTLALLWTTVTDDLPVLIRELEKIAGDTSS